MKILLLTHNETIAPRLRLEIKTLQEQGHQIKVVAWNTSGRNFNFDFPVTFIHTRRRERFYQTLAQSLAATISQLAFTLYPRTVKEILTTSWDVVHCGNLALLPVAVLGKWLKHGKVIYDSYEFPIQNLPGRLKNPHMALLMRNFLIIVEKFLLFWVDAVLTIPAVDDAERKKFAQNCRNVEVLFNVPTATGIVSQKKFLPPVSAIYTGDLTREKGLFVMLAAAALMTRDYPDFKLVLIGHLLEDAAEVENIITGLRIKDNVVLHNWVPPQELEGFLNQAWIGLWPNQPGEKFSRVTTGNSRKGFQYMKCGLPVVAPAFGEIAKAVAEEQSGLLTDTSNPEALAGAMAEIINHPELREKMSANGIAAVRTKYNWENESKKLVQIYKSLGTNN